MFDRLSPCTLVYGLVWSMVVASLGFYLGSHHHTSYTTYDFLNLQQTRHIFQYNRTFSEAPSEKTDQAWHQLFPAQGGFFRHPDIAVNRSAFSIFHQLHCLDGIRHGYWKLYHFTVEGRKMDETEIPMEAAPQHIRHCIDLLRQALMCQPDTTVEVRDDEKGGVTGFGTEHKCRDWDELVAWTSKWETFHQGPKNKKPVHEHDTDHKHT